MEQVDAIQRRICWVACLLIYFECIQKHAYVRERELAQEEGEGGRDSNLFLQT